MRSKTGNSENKQLNNPGSPDKFNPEEKEIFGQVVKLELLNGNPKPTFVGNNKSNTYFNYFLGNDSKRWASHVGLYQEALVKNVYSGIDARYYYDGSSIRYDYIVHSGGNASEIKLNVQGSKAVSVNTDGELVFNTRFGDVKQTKLFAYQENNGSKQQIACQFEKKDETISFTLGSYDHSKPLVIDPLIWSTFIGENGSEYNSRSSLILDGSNNAYVVGYTNSTNYPTTIGAYDQGHNGSYDVFVSKFSSDGASLVWSTFVGGNSNDLSSALTWDGNAVYVTGYTASANYPTTIGAYDQSHNGSYDVFVSKLTSDGSTLAWSTFIGGSSLDAGNSLVVDGSGNVYVAGYTTSANYPTTTGAYDQSHGGSNEVLVTKLNSNGSSLIWSTFVGGTNSDVCRSLAVDGSGNVYITGGTTSPDYPTTAGAYDQVYGGGATDDVLVTKINSDGASLAWSTYIGGSNPDYGNSLTLDGSGNVYVAGYTQSSGYPTTTGAYDQSYNGGYDILVTKLNSNGASLAWSTFIGGSNTEYGNSLALDGSGNVYVAGETFSTDYPTTAGAYDQSHNGGSDIFVSKLTSDGVSLVGSTFIGGSANEYGNSLALGSSSMVYVTGYTGSPDYPTTTGAYDQGHNGGTDILISKLSFAADPYIPNTPMNAVNITHNGAMLTWNYTGTDPCDSVKVYIKKTGAAGWYKIQTLSGAPTSFQRQQLQAGWNYTWQCQTFFDDSSYWGPTSSFTTAALCASFTSLNETNTTDSTASVNWSITGTADSFKVLYRRIGTATWAYVILTASSTTLTGLWQATDYEWKVQAFCNGVVATVSAVDSFSTGTTCPIPTNLTNVYYAATQHKIIWDTVSGASNYQIHWRLQGAPAWISIPNIVATNRVLTGVADASTYEWRVRTACNGTVGPWSSIMTFTHSTPKQMGLSGVDAVVYPIPTQNGTVSVRFDGISGAEYRIVVTDVLGKVITTQTGISETSNDILVNLSGASKGVYTLSLQLGEAISNYKVVVE